MNPSTALRTAPLRGEVIAPGTGITLVVAPHPFKIDAGRPLTAPAGLTVAELVEFARARVECRGRLVAAVSGEHVPEDWWRFVRPRPGTTVILRAAPAGGGGNSFINSVLLLGVLAASIFFSGGLATALLPGIVGGASLIGAGITIAGSFSHYDPFGGAA